MKFTKVTEAQAYQKTKLVGTNDFQELDKLIKRIQPAILVKPCMHAHGDIQEVII